MPNQQRTLNKPPPELRCRNFINNHRLSTQIGTKRAKNVSATCTYSNWASSISHPTVGGWALGFFLWFRHNFVDLPLTLSLLLASCGTETQKICNILSTLFQRKKKSKKEEQLIFSPSSPSFCITFLNASNKATSGHAKQCCQIGSTSISYTCQIFLQNRPYSLHYSNFLCLAAKKYAKW